MRVVVLLSLTIQPPARMTATYTQETLFAHHLTTMGSTSCTSSSPLYTDYRDAIVTAFVFVCGIYLFAAAFDVGGPGAGYLAISIVPLIICTISTRCLVASITGVYNNNNYYSTYSSGNNREPKWSLFFLGACGTFLVCMPVTLFRLRLIYPPAFLFAVLGIEIQAISIAISAISASRGGGSSGGGVDYGDF